MMLELTSCAQRGYSHLSGKNLGLPGAFQAASPASHAHFYLSLVEHLEEAVGEVDAVVEVKCRDLLAQAGRLIFTNLCQLRDSGALGGADLRLDVVREMVPDEDEEATEALENKVGALVGALCDWFQCGPEANEDGGPPGGDAGGDEGEAHDAEGE